MDDPNQPQAPVAPQTAPDNAPDASARPDSATPVAVPGTPGANALPVPLNLVQAGKLRGIALPPIVNRKTDPLQEFAVTHFGEFNQFGLDYHEFPKDGVSVLFNPKLTSVPQLEAAYKKGELAKIAPTAQQVIAALHQNSTQPAAPAAPATGAPPDPTVAAPQGQPPAPAPASSLANVKVPVNRHLQSARLQNLKPAPINTPNSPVNQLAARAI